MSNSGLATRRWLIFGAAAAAVSVGLAWLMQAMIHRPLVTGPAAEDPAIYFIERWPADDSVERKRRAFPKPRQRMLSHVSSAPPPPRQTAAIDREALLYSRPDFRRALSAPQLNLWAGPPGSEFSIGGIEGLIPRIMIQPMYPRRALLRGIEGEVVVEFTIDAAGTVIDARVVAAEPAHVFDRQSVAAVYKWRFEPVLVDGEPAQVTARQTIGFTIVDELAAAAN